jgi:hypothetical protein
MAYDADYRSLALTDCRCAVVDKAALVGGDGRLVRRDVHEVFASPEFASAVFKLFDHDNSGELWIEQVTKSVKMSFDG